MPTIKENPEVLVKLKNDAELALYDEVLTVAKAVDNLENDLKAVKESVPKLEEIITKIPIQKGDKGDQGITGENGYTPLKGKDYFTLPEVQQFKVEVTPIRGKDYFTFSDIKQFKKDVTPIKNIDYFDGINGESVVGPPGPVGPAGAIPKHEWRGAELRFENPDGSWGEFSNLQGPPGNTYTLFGGGGGGGSSLAIRNSGVLVTTAASSLNFTGTAISSITNADGSVTVTIAGGASAGGTDTQVQFNDGGTNLGGDAGFTYNKTTDTATLGNLVLTNPLPVTSGGSGTATQFTAGSVVFAGTNGVYSEDNTNFFWDSAAFRLKTGNGISFPTAGAAITAGNYSVGRDATATNNFVYNVPTSAAHVFKINNVSKLSINTTNGFVFERTSGARVTFIDSASSPSANAAQMFISPSSSVTGSFFYHGIGIGGVGSYTAVTDFAISSSNTQRIYLAWTGHIQFNQATATSSSALTGTIFTFAPANNTSLTAGTEQSNLSFESSTQTWAAGALTTQRFHQFKAQTAAFASASTITNCINVDIADVVAGTNATITNGWALRTAKTLITGTLSHTGTTAGFFSATPASQQTSGANLTNNVTSGGTSDQIDDFTNLTVYATDAAAIRNDIYQLARKLKQVNDALRLYGLLT